MKSFILLILLTISIISCKKTENNLITNEVESLTKTEIPQKKIDSFFKIPTSFKTKTDILIDSLFLNIPSEGSLIRVYRKEKGKLYITSSIATMKKYNFEIYKKLDSIYIIENTKEYDRPLTIANAKLTNRNNEYVIYVKNKIYLYVKNDTVINNDNSKKEKEIEHLLESILKKSNF